jgi:putative ABC transport system ATP-binding protein
MTLAIRDLRFAYPGGGFRLDAPAMDLAEGERLAVVGPSGSGKTTLLHLVAGILAPPPGTVRLDGVDVGALADRARRSFRARRIGFVFQGYELLDYLTVRENILYPFRIADGLRLDAEVRARVERLAEAAGVGDKLDRRPGRLSQGERQRVAICRALAARPRLVLADEPTGALDPANKTVILELLFEAAAETGAAVLAVTHDHDLLPRFDRVQDFAAFRREGAA